MRRYIFLLILSVCFISVEAQEWACDSLASSISIFNKLSSNGNKKWAEKLMPDFPLNTDGEIELNYVFNCSDTISRSELRNLTEGWIATVYSKPESVIKRSDSERLVCNGELGQVAYDQKFIGATMIYAPLEIIVLYKDNRVRLTLRTRNYRMGHANIGQFENGTIGINGTYPFNKKSDYKGAYAMAYINTVGKLLNLATGYLNYLNVHIKDSQKEELDW